MYALKSEERRQLGKGVITQLNLKVTRLKVLFRDLGTLHGVLLVYSDIIIFVVLCHLFFV